MYLYYMHMNKLNSFEIVIFLHTVHKYLSFKNFDLKFFINFIIYRISFIHRKSITITSFI
jgi:hypothetical protein